MPTLSDQLLSRLSEHLASQMGWHFPQTRWRDLQAGIEAAARELGIVNAADYARDLLAAKLTRAQIEVLAGALTIGETYFFRDPRSFEILTQQVFPELIRARSKGERRLRIWSAGCCTGEEAYSVAITLDRLLPNLSDWQITLLATDINSRFLHKAMEGTFSEWSFRGAPAWLKQQYFRPVSGRRFAIVPRIRSLVTFAYLNLGEDAYPSLTNNTNAMDLILCRNVLMYFSPERADQVMQNFHRSLVENGLFLTSAVETSPQLAKYFVTVPFEGAVLYRKKSERDIGREVSQPNHAASIPWFASAGEIATLEPAEVITVPAKETAQEESHVANEMPSPYTMALALYERGDYLEAARVLNADETAAAASESSIDRAILRARIHANIGDLPAARLWAERAVATDRTNPASHYLLAVILQEQNELIAASMALQKTLYLEPQFVLAYFALGNLEQRQGRHSVAVRHFGSALSLLRHFDDNDVLPHSDGMAAGRLKEMIQSIVAVDAA